MAPRLRLAVLLAGLAVSLALTYFALHDIDLGKFWSAIRDGDPAWLAPALGVFAAAYVLRLVRWRLLFDPALRPETKPLVRAMLAGEFFTTLLPAIRLGEIARVVVLHRAAGTPRSDTVGTLVTERAFDTAALLLLLFLAVPFAPPVTWLRGAAIFLGILAACAVVAVVVLARFGSRPIGFLLRPVGRLPGFSRARAELAAAGILRGLRGLRNARVAGSAFVLSILSWSLIAVSYKLAMRVVGIDLGLDAGIIVAVATTFSLLLPALPASLGIFEAATLVALRPFGVSDARAVSAGVVIHVVTFAPFLVLGPLALRGHSLPRAGGVMPPQPQALQETDSRLDEVPRGTSSR